MSYRSKVELQPLIGSRITPKVAESDFSGLRCELLPVSKIAVGRQERTGVPGAGFEGLGQSCVSLPPANVKPDFPVSATFGARKPVARVPRNANTGLGVHLNPADGVNELF